MGHDARNNPFSREYKPEQSGVLDARKRPLQIGDEILLVTQHPIYYRVIDIKPAIDPRLPPNQQVVEVAAAIHFITTSGQSNMEFIRVRTAEEAGPSNLVRLPDEAPAEPQADGPKVVEP